MAYNASTFHLLLKIESIGTGGGEIQNLSLPGIQVHNPTGPRCLAYDKMNMLSLNFQRRDDIVRDQKTS